MIDDVDWRKLREEALSLISISIFLSDSFAYFLSQTTATSTYSNSNHKSIKLIMANLPSTTNKDTGSMMFIGETCSLDDCGREDFLPFRCPDCSNRSVDRQWKDTLSENRNERTSEGSASRDHVE